MGDEASVTIALALQASAASEAGRVAEMYPLIDEARELALQQRQLFAQLFLNGLEIPWLAMRDEFDRVHELTAAMVSIHERIGVPASGDALVGAFLMDMLWSGRDEDLVQVLGDVEGVKVQPIDASVAAILGRTGRVEQARERLLRSELDLSQDWWFSTMVLSMAGEAALYAGVPDIAATAYDRLLPFAGMPAASGSGTVIGPVDTFLALSALATGERDLATRHADDAVRLCAEWEVPLAAACLAKRRELEYSF